MICIRSFVNTVPAVLQTINVFQVTYGCSCCLFYVGDFAVYLYVICHWVHYPWHILEWIITSSDLFSEQNISTTGYFKELTHKLTLISSKIKMDLHQNKKLLWHWNLIGPAISRRHGGHFSATTTRTTTTSATTTTTTTCQQCTSTLVELHATPTGRTKILIFTSKAILFT